MNMQDLTITNEQIDDIPLLLGIIESMGIRRIIDAQVNPHGAWQGISVGTVVVIWLCYILTERDHRLVVVRDWVNARKETFEELLEIELRDTDMTDDRLANVLTMLGESKNATELDVAMMQEWIRVYKLPTEVARLDSTTVSVYHEVEEEESLLKHGHSKDHRPDLRQFKIMLSTLDPLGVPVSHQVVAGNRADDGLYIPAYDATVGALGTRDVLIVGDNKMSAFANRAHIAMNNSRYLCAYLPGPVQAEIDEWVEAALKRRDSWQELVKVDETTGELHILAHIDEWEREQSCLDPETEEIINWTERVLVVRSEQMRAGLCKRQARKLERVVERVEKLRLPPKRGRRRYRSEAAIKAKVAGILEKAGMQDILRVGVREETLPDGTTRWTIDSYWVDLAAWRAMTEHLGWAVYVSSTTPEQYDAPALVLAYRRQVGIEYSISRVKTRNLNIRPVYLRDEQRIEGMTCLLMLALRVLTLTEYRLRTALDERDEAIVGLNPASRTQATRRPTTERVLRAFRNITLAIIHTDEHRYRHVTALNPTQQHVLSLLQLPGDLYARLGTFAPNSP